MGWVGEDGRCCFHADVRSIWTTVCTACYRAWAVSGSGKADHASRVPGLDGRGLLHLAVSRYRPGTVMLTLPPWLRITVRHGVGVVTTVTAVRHGVGVDERACACECFRLSEGVC